MSKSFKRYEPSHFDDDKYDKRVKGGHLKHVLKKESSEELDIEEDFHYKDEVEYFMKKWK